MEPDRAQSSITPLVVIVGETASGKSSLALALAQRYGGEIISADSWTVYPGFDTGTAKPSASEQALVPHHLLEVASASDGFSAPQFQRLALAAINDITARGKLAIMAGGTGLYIDSVLFNYSFLPPSDASERARLNSLPLAALVEQARELGLPLETIDPRNKRRVVRLIENGGQLPSKTSLRPNTLLLGLAPPRAELEARISARVDAMLAHGLEKEAANLAKRYGWEAEPMKGIGYREWQAYFLGVQTLAETRAKIISASQGLAKRQRTWFNHNSGIHWLANGDEVAEAVDLITTFLDT